MFSCFVSYFMMLKGDHAAKIQRQYKTEKKAEAAR